MPKENTPKDKTKLPQQELTHKNKVTHNTKHLAKPKFRKAIIYLYIYSTLFYSFFSMQLFVPLLSLF